MRVSRQRMNFFRTVKKKKEGKKKSALIIKTPIERIFFFFFFFLVLCCDPTQCKLLFPVENIQVCFYSVVLPLLLSKRKKKKKKNRNFNFCTLSKEKKRKKKKKRKCENNEIVSLPTMSWLRLNYVAASLYHCVIILLIITISDTISETFVQLQILYSFQIYILNDV